MTHVTALCDGQRPRLSIAILPNKLLVWSLEIASSNIAAKQRIEIKSSRGTALVYELLADAP